MIQRRKTCFPGSNILRPIRKRCPIEVGVKACICQTSDKRQRGYIGDQYYPIRHAALVSPSAAYAAVATDFDASTDYFTRGAAYTGIVAGKLGTGSFWMNSADVTSLQVLFYSITATRVWAQLQTTSKLQFFFRGGAGAVRWEAETTTSLVNGTWHHVMYSFDVNAGVNEQHLYLDGAEDKNTTAGPVDGTVFYQDPEDWSIGATVAGGSKWDGCLSDFYFNSVDFLDLSVASNREKFIKSGKPVDAGSDGSDPTGAIPMVYLRNGFATWGTNLGNGGSLTDQGSAANCADAP